MFAFIYNFFVYKGKKIPNLVSKANQEDNRIAMDLETLTAEILRSKDDSIFQIELPDDLKEELKENAVVKTLRKGEKIFQEGNPVDSLTYIVEGSVKLISYDGSGREKLLGFFRKGEALWNCFYRVDHKYPFSAVCLNDVKVIEISRDFIEKAITLPDISSMVIGMLAEQLGDSNERNMVLSASTPEERLAGFFLYSLRHNRDEVLTRRLDDIAASINLRQETVSRYIQRFVRDGLIRKTAQSSFVITDVEGLEKIFQRNENA